MGPTGEGLKSHSKSLVGVDSRGGKSGGGVQQIAGNEVNFPILQGEHAHRYTTAVFKKSLDRQMLLHLRAARG